MGAVNAVGAVTVLLVSSQWWFLGGLGRRRQRTPFDLQLRSGNAEECSSALTHGPEEERVFWGGGGGDRERERGLSAPLLVWVVYIHHIHPSRFCPLPTALHHS